MRTLNAAGVGASASTLIVHHAWPIGSALVFAGVVRLMHGLLAERARRRTLEMLCERAPAGTLVVQQRGPGGAAMTVKIGEPVRESGFSVTWPDGVPASRELPGKDHR